MGLVEKDLSYLKEPRFIGYGQAMFGNIYRLPILASILELTPTTELTFRQAQVAKMTAIRSGDVHVELQRNKNMNMVWQIASDNRYDRLYYRVESPKWEIARVAVKSAREELGL